MSSYCHQRDMEAHVTSDGVNKGNWIFSKESVEDWEKINSSIQMRTKTTNKAL